MGQSVGNLSHNHKKEKRFKSMKSMYEDSDDTFRSNYDVTEAILANAKFDIINSEDTSSNSMSFSFSNQDQHLKRHNVADIASKIPSSAWSGYHLLQMSNDQVATSKFLRAATMNQPLATEDYRTVTILSPESGPETEDHPEIDQLISMMQKHRVSEDTAAFHFDFELPKDELSQSPIVEIPFDPSCEFQFSFPQPDINNNTLRTATTPTTTTSTGNDISLAEYVALSPSGNASPETLSQRKILPLKKSRRRRVIEKSKHNKEENNDTPKNTNEADANQSLLAHKNDRTANLQSLPYSNITFSSQPYPTVNNDTTKYQLFTTFTTPSNSPFTTLKNDALPTINMENPLFPIKKDSVDNSKPLKSEAIGKFNFESEKRPFFVYKGKSEKNALPNVFLNESDKPSPSVYRNPFPMMKSNVKEEEKPIDNNNKRKKIEEPTIVEKKEKPKTALPTTKELGNLIDSVHANKGKKPTKTTNKKKTTKTRKNETIAPGGFLSSDITLFDSPISDDFICLFCQYDILTYGLKDTKRKNGYYRRKKDRQLNEVIDGAEEH